MMQSQKLKNQKKAHPQKAINLNKLNNFVIKIILQILPKNAPTDKLNFTEEK